MRYVSRRLILRKRESQIQRSLVARGLTRVMSEGGPRVASALILQGLADECLLFTSPKPLARPGVESLSPAARARLADANHYSLVEDGLAGNDRLRIYDRVL